MVELISGSPDETSDAGKQIAKHLGNGSVVALQGTLGSGKTCLTKGIALGLGIKENITSPTYTIINEYPIPSGKADTLYHIDVYRLNSEKEFDDLGGQEIINSNGISVIEWSERISGLLPDNTIMVLLEITEVSLRRILIQGLDKL